MGMGTQVQDGIHKALECRRGIPQPKGHPEVFKQTPSGYHCRLMYVFRGYRYLHETVLEVNGSKHIALDADL